MKLDENAFAIASGSTAGVLWIICSLIVIMLPGPMSQMGSHMTHGDMSAMTWSLSLPGVILGLIGWVVFAALTGWLFAFFYNRFTS